MTKERPEIKRPTMKELGIRRVVAVFRDADGGTSKSTTIYNATPEEALSAFERVMAGKVGQGRKALNAG